MNPLAIYQKQISPQATLENWTRIDMLLALFDKTIERLEVAQHALEKNDYEQAKDVLLRVNLLVGELAAGVIPGASGTADNLLKLYEFVLHCVNFGDLEKIEAALKVLRTLHEGFLAIRPEAVNLERNGEIPPIHADSTIQLTA